MTRKMPAQKPGKSKQDYLTPRDFLDAVEARFGKITIDLAASREHRVVERYISPKRDSLKIAWRVGSGVGWLNPPFDDIRPWARKCLIESAELEYGGKILLLTPASVGSEWFRKYIWRRAEALALNGRLVFVGETAGYPKDLMLTIFRCYSDREPAFNLWDWRKEV